MASREPDPGGYAAAKPKPNHDAVPPAALDLERAIVACCLCDPAAIEAAKRHMDPADCYDDRHRWAMQAVIAVHTATGRADVVAVLEWLREAGHADQLPSGYLVDLANVPGSTAMVGVYAKKVRQCRILREMLAVSHRLQAEGYARRCNPDAVTELWDGLHRRVESLRQAKRAADDADQPTLGAELSELADAIARGEPDGKVMPTGFRRLDELLGGGARGGQLVVVAGRPGEGKTTFALNLTRRWCEAGKRVLFVSLEMQRRELYLKLASSVAGQDIARHGNVWDVGRRTNALAAVSDWRLRINDTDSQALSNVWDWVTGTADVEPCDAVVIDNIQEIRQDPRDRLHEAIGKCARAFKQLAKRLDVPVLLLAQASRDIEGRGLDADYRMSDVADSKGIEAAADVVLFCWRPNDGDMRLPPGYREWQVAKNRSGSTGAVRCDFDGEAATWRESDADRITRRAESSGPNLRGLRGGRASPKPRSDLDG